jgi:hypothetical protein
MTTVIVEYDCCGRVYAVPTVVPVDGSALHHASAVDTVINIIDAQHEQDHHE